MSNVHAEVGTEPRDLPPGKLEGALNYKIAIRGGDNDGFVTVDFDTVDAVEDFPQVDLGSYTMTVQRLDKDGAALGDPFSQDFDVVASTFGQPVSIAITVSPDAARPQVRAAR